MNKNQKMPRKLRKILVEKKRRERIDGCLKQIKELLFQGTEFQNDYMRMEKADILENVVKFIKCQNLHERPDRASSEYRLGYIHCMREVTQVMEQICGKSTTPLVSLQHYFNNKLNNLAYSDTPRIKEETTHHFSTPVVPGLGRCGAFSPVYPGNIHPIDTCMYKQGHMPAFYSPNMVGDRDYVSDGHISASNVIKIEPKNESESKPSGSTTKHDSSFETAQIVPDSTSQLSIQIPEPEVNVIENNNNNGNMLQQQNIGQDDNMWRPW